MPLHLETEPRDLLLKNNDLVIDADLQWVRGIDAIAQECRIALSVYRGEWFLDLERGISYWDGILGGRRDAAIAIARTEIQDTLLAIDGVVEVTKLTLDFDGETRALKITWRVRTAFGETPVDTLTTGVTP